MLFFRKLIFRLVESNTSSRGREAFVCVFRKPSRNLSVVYIWAAWGVITRPLGGPYQYCRCHHLETWRLLWRLHIAVLEVRPWLVQLRAEAARHNVLPESV